jgi:hypothetical protein
MDAVDLAEGATLYPHGIVRPLIDRAGATVGPAGAGWRAAKWGVAGSR